MNKKLGLTLIWILFAIISQAQSCGCTDLSSSNYNPGATCENRTCIYSDLTLPPQLFYALPSKLAETSGILSIYGKIYTHNDSGNPAELYELSEDKETIIHTVKILGAGIDPDWEDICADQKYIYISDAGNNKGKRTDLNILRIPIQSLYLDSVATEKIEFHYADQTDFTKRKHGHNFDCEALFCWNDTLHLFTKNWQNKKTNHYILPAKIGEQTAKLIDSFDVGMLVTGADLSPNKKMMVLCGYDEEGNTQLWFFKDYIHTDFFHGNKRKIKIGTTQEVGQLEAVCFKDNEYIYLTNEEIKNLVSANLWGLSINNIFNGIPSPLINSKYIADASKHPVKDQHLVNLEIACPRSFTADIYLINEKGKIIFQKNKFAFNNGYNQVKLIPDELKNGNYFIYIRTDETNILVDRFLIR